MRIQRNKRTAQIQYAKRLKSKTRGNHPARKKRLKRRAAGVSVITCTHSPDFIDNTLRNYAEQSWQQKELVLILNNDQLDLGEWKERAEEYSNVRVFQLPGASTLGVCLNYAVDQARYPYVAKFDHDDYYDGQYLAEMMRIFRNRKVEVAGKRSYYTYIEDGNLLIKRFPGRESRLTRMVHGATFVMKKKVAKRIRFADVPIDDDGIFLRTCRARGIRVYSATQNHYVYMRRKEQDGHGWRVDYDYLLRHARVIGHPNSLEDIIKRVTVGKAAGRDFETLERELGIAVNRHEYTVPQPEQASTVI